MDLPDDGPDFLTDDTLHEAYELEIESEKGNKVRFGELVAGKGDSITTIVIFIRHFFCVYDQDYTRNVASQMTQKLLDTVPASARPAQVILLGCGDHSLILPYMEETSDQFPIYTDPSGRIYEKLQMKRTMRGFTEPPPYSNYSLPTGLGECLKQIWKRGWAGLRGGNWTQQGGEWIFQRGKLRYAHRMEGARDHLTAERLLEILNVAHGKGDDLPSTREEGEEVDEEVQGSNCESRAQGTEYIYIRP
ncbi:hypothetical protein N7517_008678 [Penicillium concentricum]|uniref:Thioredoxin-like fold domain-containing protein n=1 Tax=Penicillium concentricum TaxID=293559 RepID=A0A9W9RT61_9EURO|nr:uncharacterized protein N7517_008678 [Penicillium concentricum]KAJ5365792.1 hypothetical protein N7517_008678 [Penicillium concentricum]